MDSLLDIYHDALVDGLTTAAGKMAERLREEAPLNYKNAITVGIVREDEGTMSIEIEVAAPLTSSTVNVLPFEDVNETHLAHIEPLRAKVLAFLWPNAPASVQITQPKFPLVFFKHVDVRVHNAMPDVTTEAQADTFVSSAMQDMSQILEDEMTVALSTL